MSRSELSKEFQELRELANQQGWNINQTKRLHWQFVPPCTQAQIVIFAGSPSDHRAIKNFVSRLRMNGLNVPHKKPRPRKKR